MQGFAAAATKDFRSFVLHLHIYEPENNKGEQGEHCYYSNLATKIGGNITRDFTEGFGPAPDSES